MVIAVRASAAQKEEWLSKGTAPGVEVIWIENEIPAADAYFDLLYEDLGSSFENTAFRPLFVNAVINTCSHLPAKALRMNAWTGFLKRDIIEVAVNQHLDNANALAILDSFQWKYQLVPDIPGMIAARSISMIINEAYFALGDEVSSKQDIDIAMKLGTNYPFGPFEWSERIGLHRIFRLLKILSETDGRYVVAPALEQELKTIA